MAVVLSKTQKLLDITPNEQIFKMYCFAENATYIRLTNITSSKIVYKIKTTAPGLVTVSPFQSIIEPDTSVTVMIRLRSDVNPSSLNLQDPNTSAFKFLIQSAIYTDKMGAMAPAWSLINQSHNPEQPTMSQQKLTFHLVKPEPELDQYVLYLERRSMERATKIDAMTETICSQLREIHTLRREHDILYDIVQEDPVLAQKYNDMIAASLKTSSSSIEDNQ